MGWSNEARAAARAVQEFHLKGVRLALADEVMRVIEDEGINSSKAAIGAAMKPFKKDEDQITRIIRHNNKNKNTRGRIEWDGKAQVWAVVRTEKQSEILFEAETREKKIMDGVAKARWNRLVWICSGNIRKAQEIRERVEVSMSVVYDDAPISVKATILAQAVEIAEFEEIIAA